MLVPLLLASNATSFLNHDNVTPTGSLTSNWQFRRIWVYAESISKKNMVDNQQLVIYLYHLKFG